MTTGISRIYRNIFLFLGVALFFLAESSFAIEKMKQSGSLQRAAICWVERQDTAYELFFSSFQKGEWSTPIQVTDSNSVNYVPTLADDGHNSTWIVWSAKTESGIELHFAVIRRGIIVQSPKIIETGMSSNVGPDLAFVEGKPLVVWAGNNGDIDDVYSSSWEGGSWSEPSRIHPKNNIPDYLPDIITDDAGEAHVKWYTFGPDGQLYKKKKFDSSIITKNVISINVEVKRQQSLGQALSSCLPELPASVTNPELSTIEFLCDGATTPQQVKFAGRLIKKAE